MDAEPKAGLDSQNITDSIQPAPKEITLDQSGDALNLVDFLNSAAFEPIVQKEVNTAGSDFVAAQVESNEKQAIEEDKADKGAEEPTQETVEVSQEVEGFNQEAEETNQGTEHSDHEAKNAAVKNETVEEKAKGSAVKKRKPKGNKGPNPGRKGVHDDNFKVTIRQPIRPFHTLSASQQRAIVSGLKRGIELISGGDVQRFFEHLCEKTEFGKENLKPVLGRKQLDEVITNIRNLHERAVPNKKPALLSLVANQFPYKQLLGYGFKASASQFSRARTINKRGAATLEDYVRVMPPSKRPKEDIAVRKPKAPTKPRAKKDSLLSQPYESQITFDFDLTLDPELTGASLI